MNLTEQVPLIFASERFASHLRAIIRGFIWVLVISLTCADLRAAQNGTQGPPGGIQSIVDEAKRSHLDRVDSPAPILLFADPKTPEAAVDKSSVVVAVLIAKVTTHTDLFIITWNKFRLTETLHHQPKVLNEEFPSDIPPSLLPVEPGEFLVGTFTGSELIDGVTVSVTDPLISELKISQTYVLFLTFRSPSVASPLFGHGGMFLLDAAGSVSPVKDINYNKLAAAFRDRHIDHIEELRSLVSTHK